MLQCNNEERNKTRPAYADEGFTRVLAVGKGLSGTEVGPGWDLQTELSRIPAGECATNSDHFNKAEIVT